MNQASVAALIKIREGINELIDANLGASRSDEYRTRPGDKYPNGMLTSQGLSRMFKAFDSGLKPPTVAKLMGISTGGAYYRYTDWKQARA